MSNEKTICERREPDACFWGSSLTTAKNDRDSSSNPTTTRRATTTASREDEPSIAASNPAGGSHNINNCLQTPHTLRLLKLIHEGSPEYAETAIDRLETIVGRTGSSSSLVLWDLLGRLAMILTSESWKTRQAAARALQVMAKYLPTADQRNFLEADSFHGEHDATLLTTTALYLTVPELLQEQTGIDKILQHGKELWALAEERYDCTSSAGKGDDDDDSKIHNLDCQASHHADFVQHRIRMQRSILASRLGLAAITDVLGDSIDSTLFISNDDLKLPQTTVPPFSRKRKCTEMSEQLQSNTAATSADQAIQAESQDPNSIRALLVMEIQKQQQQQDRHQYLHCHTNPQNLLTTELIYRMMDVRWHVRHGAILGIQALIHAWRKHASKFGAWPNDVLSRCLCILAMDRFGDFANADGVVVAPVREVAGQLIALLAIQMNPPESIQTATLDVLHRLLQHANDWEVRHGAMLAFKYMSVVIVTDTTVSDDENCRRRQRCFEPREKFMLESMGRAAIQHLDDPSDDVKSASAQTLLWIIRDTKREQEFSKLVEECAVPVLRALQTNRTISACLVDHVGLFAVLLEEENISDVMGRIATQGLTTDFPIGGNSLARIFIQILDSDFPAVRVSALRSISRISKISVFHQSCELDTRKELCALVEKVYLIFCAPREEHLDETTVDRELQTMLKKAWTELSVFAGRIFDSADLKKLFSQLLSIYFEVGYKHEIDPDEDLRHVEAADYLAFFCCQTNREILQEIVLFSLLVFSESPWPSHFEATCLFYRALIREGYPQSCLKAFASKLSLDCPPVCAHSTRDAVRNNIESLPTLFDELCSDMLSNASALSFNSVEAANTVTKVFKQKLSVYDLSFCAEWPDFGFASMRIQTAIAGLALSKGLPQKVTPLVRALMTSFKNELHQVRRHMLTGTYIEELLHQMRIEAKLEKARQKIFQALSDAALGDVAMVKTTAFKIIRKCATMGLENIPPVWSRLNPLLMENVLTLVDTVILEATALLNGLSHDSSPGDELVDLLIENFSGPLLILACENRSSHVRCECAFSLVSFCQSAPQTSLRHTIPSLCNYFKDRDREPIILNACFLLNSIVDQSGIAISPFVRRLLPVVLSVMNNPNDECAQTANNIFSHLVRAAPLVRNKDDYDSRTDDTASVIDHLIFGKPLPICNLPEEIGICLRESKTVLRHYQLEGISWLEFLRTVKLSGALCDSMGLGKTLQALVAVALAQSAAANCRSLVICPSTLVGHWLGEIDKYFPGQQVFRPLPFVGSRAQRNEKWRNLSSSANIVVTSYTNLRSDIELLLGMNWCYCILDEGHMLRNPKTATAIATRRIRAQHKLVLTGTPIQNNVTELWAIFDFLMPNFLGSADSFAKHYSIPITKSTRPFASASDIAEGIKRLKILHQQVLPFILRRDKSEVLQELPPKNISVIRVPMSDIQSTIYSSFCKRAETRECLQAFDAAMLAGTVNIPGPTLKTLLFLRLLCTHPCLVLPAISNMQSTAQFNRIESSGKVLALLEILREAGIYEERTIGADNDSSILYTDDDVHDQEIYDFILDDQPNGSTLHRTCFDTEVNNQSKCLIFAQFTRSLDMVENLLFKVHMPSVRYVRLDGNVSPGQRTGIVESFIQEPTIRVMLLTTRVGGLGLNLSCAETVILLESDFNPFADLQAIDRAHRIGTSNTVNVYRLITQDTIEEKILQLQRKKIEISNAIINSDNSSMHSMGTDRLLDVLTFERPQTSESLLSDIGFDLEGLVENCAEDYAYLSVEKFTESLQSN